MQALGLILLALGMVMSVNERRLLLMWRSQPTSSPLSTGLAQLVGTAGGIYLALELLFSFLKIPQDWWSDSVFVVEPLALISLFLAIIQPFVIRAWMRFRR
ncbi:MAG: hypothetical protein QMC95_09900 [Desulfitobacteriaceae bacterium]|nr:hypothetical protein [Desulfitobacteriaceae bacterium]MDI6880046.1 hypothetical protein [Desulfitobacteriaceae bacterium]MDI6914522.1 hypothetical protein [Desulfitobacteriaceae bacterium]